MIVKATKHLKEDFILEGPDKTITISPKSQTEVPDSWINLPLLRSAIAKSMVAVSNFCGFIVGEGVAKITVSATPPASPRTGDLWIDIS